MTRKTNWWMCLLGIAALMGMVAPSGVFAQDGEPPLSQGELAQVRENLEWSSQAGALRTFWEDGLVFENFDSSFRLKVGGRVHLDFGTFDFDSDVEDAYGDEEDSNEFRRARISIEGLLYGNYEFKVEFDYDGGDANFKDVYMGIRDLGVDWLGGVRFGHFKEPFGLEALTSSNDITFMERSLTGTFTPLRNTGIMFYDSVMNGNMTWAVGVFRESDEFGDGVGDDYNITARLTYLPWWQDDHNFVHVGGSYSYKSIDDGISFSARPESHMAPIMADTGFMMADNVHLLGAEAAWVCDSFSLQGEYVLAMVDGIEGGFFGASGDADFSAASIQASYFLTGESRPYNRSTGTFGRIKPNKNFLEDGGMGAWEVAARYSMLDLNDGGIDGGEMDNVTIGVNWHMNPNMRLMFDYTLADTDEGDANIFMTRFAISF